MSVWAAAPVSPLSGAEGALFSVLVSVEPLRLEALLDALAGLEFPINPQIYHDAPGTLVEFPAYENRLAGIRKCLQQNGFSVDSVKATSMLDSIHADWRH